MKIDIVTIFPQMIRSVLEESLLKSAQDRGLLDISVHDLRDWTTGKHRTVDDIPYGGGAGMVMKPEPFFDCVEEIAGQDLTQFRKQSRIILTSPRGRRLDQEYAVELANSPHIVILCGRYEGVDERVATDLATEEISIGDYVLNGGEVPALVIVEAVARLTAGFLGTAESLAEESFGNGLLEYPQYTRPPDYRGLKVPEVLLSGHHAKIAQWRRQQAIIRTLESRPDLLSKAALSMEERESLVRETENDEDGDQDPAF